jgi:hypothetical protein
MLTDSITDYFMLPYTLINFYTQSNSTDIIIILNLCKIKIATWFSIRRNIR